MMNKMDNEYIFKIDGLSTIFHTYDGDVKAVDGASYAVKAGEIVGIVGESGCGKSVTQFSALKLIKTPPGEITAGKVMFHDQNILEYKKNSKEMRAIRGGKISMIFQEPITSLNPALTVGQQLMEALQLHMGMNPAQARTRAVEMLKTVGIPDAESRIDYYPHQFSGGMCQRVMIAMAISCEPEVLIADEATTALDVTTQEQILDLLKMIAEKFGTAVILITHNLGIVARYAQRIYVMYAGRVIESGTTMEIFKNPHHPYTRGLLRAVPRLDVDKNTKLVPIDGVPPRLIDKPNRCDFCNRCKYVTEICENSAFPPVEMVTPGHEVCCYRQKEIAELEAAEPEQKYVRKEKTFSSEEKLLSVENLSMAFPGPRGMFKKGKDVLVLDKVNFDLYKGETLGLVGESGCGKSTVANCILRFLEPTGGKIVFDGKDITHLSSRDMYPLRKDIQIVSQNPFAALDPRQSVGTVLREPLIIHKLYKTRQEMEKRVDELLELVGLSPYMKDRMPHEFSGGQRQRICIARALALNPKLLVCDEPISALDVSIQAQIVNLFQQLQEQLGLSYLFVAHDLAVIRHISDRIVVMYLGQVVEVADWKEIYDRPLHPYTQALLSAVPIPDPAADMNRERITLSGEVASVANRIHGCNFCKRCRYAKPECETTPPILREVLPGHFCSCMMAGRE